MFIFITILISYLITLSIVFGTKAQTKTRRNVSSYWSGVEWKDSDEKPKWMVGILLLNYIICVIPVLNIIWSILFLIWYFRQLEGPCWDSGINLVATRIVYSNKITIWFTKKV